MLAAIVGPVGASLLRLLGATWRIREIGLPHAETARGAGGGALFAVWHEYLLPQIYIRRDHGVTALISQHHDGELIARVVHRLGFQTVRGSSTRGGYRALVAMARLGRAGSELAITPDGPRGPRRVVQVGGLIIAQRGRIPVIPAALAAHPVKRLDSWDRFAIPRPFARVVVGYGEPLWIPGEIKPAELEHEWIPRLAHAMATLQEKLDDALMEWIGHATNRS